MANGELTGAYAKLDWVDSEIAALDEEIKAVGKTEGYTTSSDFYPQANVVAVRIEPFVPPRVWGVRAGNIVHCCRSALDYLVCDLVFLNGRRPVEGSGGNQFPIFDKPPTSGKGKTVSFAEKTARSLAGVAQAHVAMIEAIQPYQPENDFGRAPNPFSMLRDRSNADKHRLLRPIAAGLVHGQQVPYELTAERDISRILDHQILFRGPHIRSGAVVAFADVVPTGPDPRLKLEAELPLQVIWDDGYAVFKSLAHIALSVRNILGWFEPVFAGKEPGERPTPQRGE